MTKRLEEIKARLAELPCKSWVWDGYALLSEQGNGVVCDFGDDKDPHPKAVTKWIECAPEDIAWLVSELDRAHKHIEDTECKFGEYRKRMTDKMQALAYESEAFSFDWFREEAEET